MYNVINRFAISKEVNHGLMLIDMPTGSGKTYNAVKYIFDASILKVLALVASKFKNTNGTDYANSWLRSRYNQ